MLVVGLPRHGHGVTLRDSRVVAALGSGFPGGDPDDASGPAMLDYRDTAGGTLASAGD